MAGLFPPVRDENGLLSSFWGETACAARSWSKGYRRGMGMSSWIMSRTGFRI